MRNTMGSAARLAALGAVLAVALSLTAVGPAQAARTSAQAHHASVLPLSPLSTSVLVDEAIRAGRLHPSSENSGLLAPNLLCGTPPCVLPNARASEGGMPVNEDPLAINPANNKQWLTGGNDYNCATLQGFYTSNNAGSSWTHTCMNALPGASGDGDPGVGYDLQGNAYATGIDRGTADGSDIVFEKSSDNGATWSAPAVAVSPTFTGGLTDKDWLQIDTNAASPYSNSLYISVTQFDAAQKNTVISVSHSRDGGATWATVAVDTEQIYPALDQFSDLAVGKDGTVYVSWMRCTANGRHSDCGGTTATMMIAKSADGGNTWSAPVVAATVKLAPDSCGVGFYGCLPNTSERVSNIPAIGIDNSTGSHAGNLYMVMYNWTTSRFMQVQVTTSTDGGTTWSTPVIVAPPTATHDQFFPWLSVGPKGTVGVTWLDRRNDSANTSYEPFAALSANGSRFGANVQISAVPSNPNNDGFGGSFMGDYTGNAWASALTLAMSWMDARSKVNMQDEVGGYKR